MNSVTGHENMTSCPSGSPSPSSSSHVLSLSFPFSPSPLLVLPPSSPRSHSPSLYCSYSLYLSFISAWRSPASDMVSSYSWKLLPTTNPCAHIDEPEGNSTLLFPDRFLVSWKYLLASEVHHVGWAHHLCGQWMLQGNVYARRSLWEWTLRPRLGGRHSSHCSKTKTTDMTWGCLQCIVIIATMCSSWTIRISTPNKHQWLWGSNCLLLFP